MASLTGSGNFIAGTKPTTWREYTSAYSIKIAHSSGASSTFSTGTTADTTTGLTGSAWTKLEIGDVVSINGLPVVVTMTHQGQPEDGFGQSRSPTVNLEEHELMVDLGPGRTYQCNIILTSGNAKTAGASLRRVFISGHNLGAFSTDDDVAVATTYKALTADHAILLDDVPVGTNTLSQARVLFR